MRETSLVATLSNHRLDSLPTCTATIRSPAHPTTSVHPPDGGRFYRRVPMTELY